VFSYLPGLPPAFSALYIHNDTDCVLWAVPQDIVQLTHAIQLQPVFASVDQGLHAARLPAPQRLTRSPVFSEVFNTERCLLWVQVAAGSDFPWERPYFMSHNIHAFIDPRFTVA